MNEGPSQSRERRPDRAAQAIAVGLAIVGVIIIWSTFYAGSGAGNYARVGPKTFPYVIAGGLLVMAVWTWIEALRGDFPEREEQAFGPMIWIVGGLAAQMLLLKIAGFSIATGILFGATAYGFGRRPLWFTTLVGIVLAFVVWVIFAKGLQLGLPAGPLERLI